MAFKFTKLNIGDTVTTSGSKCFKRLDVEQDPAPAVPKGSIISVEEKDYRVMSVQGTIALLMANYNIGEMAMYTWNVPTTAFDSYTGAKYEGSYIDTYLNSTYYNSLSDTLKAAIVPTGIVQSMYFVKWGTDYSNLTVTASDGSIYSGGQISKISVDGTRNVFVLDMDDLAKYFGSDTTVSASMLKELLETPTEGSGYMWTRSATDLTSYFRSAGYNGTYGWNTIFSTNGSSTSKVVPAFIVDLSKITYTLIE